MEVSSGKTEPLRSQIHIVHKGCPPKSKGVFSTVNRHPKFTANDGEIIYSLKDPESCLPIPHNQSDKTLRFNSKFESGNLAEAYSLPGDTYRLVLEADPNKSGSCQWFYFQVKNIRKDTKYTFILTGFHKPNGVFSTGAKVFFYSEKQASLSNISWFRSGTNYSYGWDRPRPDSDDGVKKCSLQFQMKFPYDDDTVYMAYGLPYTYTDLLSYITAWERRAPSIVSTTVLCKSYGGRNCPMLTLTNPLSKCIKENIVLTGRCHPGETNGSVVLHGLIDFLLSGSPNASYLLDRYVITVVPMLCIDGVIEGNYRVCLCGSDLNRVWSEPDREKHPIVWETKELVRRLKPKIYVDFHGHSRMNGTFAFGCPIDEPEMKGRERVLPKIIALLSEAFSYSKCTFTMPPGRMTASRCVFKTEFGIDQSFTVETSFGGIASGRLASILYDETIWKEIGAKIGDAMYHFVTDESSRLRSMAERELKLVSEKPVRLLGDFSPVKRKLTDDGVVIKAGKSAILSASCHIINSRSKSLGLLKPNM